MAGKHGSRSNYADKDGPSEIVEHRVFYHSDMRAYTPSDGNSKEIYGQLATKSTGDWSWKPGRDVMFGYGKDSTFRTFKGVPPGAAELYGRNSYSPA